MKELTQTNSAFHQRSQDFKQQLTAKDDVIREKEESLKAAVGRVVELQSELQRFVNKHGSQIS